MVLAGGRSSRMGMPKAALEWHGSTLLYRTVAIVARATAGPVVVVRAKGQELPGLPWPVIVVDDPREGRGPVQGVAAGLAALSAQAEAAFVAATDLPFLHPAFIGRLLRALHGGQDVALPVARGYPQPLAAAYRTGLSGLAERLAGAGRLKPAFLFAECAVARLDEAALLADPALARLDPALDSVINVNTPGEYRAARRRPAPEVTVRLAGALAAPGRPGEPSLPGPGARQVRAATLRAAADAAGLPHGQVAAGLNGGPVTRDPLAPLAAGDVVEFMPAGRAGRGPGGTGRWREKHASVPGNDRRRRGDRPGRARPA